MKDLLKVIIIVGLVGILTACMNTSEDGKQSETDEQNKTNNEQTEEEYNQDDPDKQKDFNRNKDNENKQRNFDRNKDQKHPKGHHKRDKSGERTPTNENNQEEIVLENEAFEIFEPAPKSNVNDQFVVRGLARVFEGTIQYEFEDNHSTLDEGYTTASKGAPDWGEFEIIIDIDKSAHRSARIILYEESAKDGSKINELIIPVHVKR